MIARPLNQLWYGDSRLKWALYPFSLAYRCVHALRRAYFESFKQKSNKVPVIVVGNLTVGGVGKTPLVIHLAKALTQKGLKVGIISRGYRAKTQDYPCWVDANSNPSLVGDEPKLIATQTQCPVVIDPKRVRGIKYLVEEANVDVIISDDGLQHYKMARDIEIVVKDGQRQFGNGLCLPAGPLREPLSRLRQVDWLIENEGNGSDGYRMRCEPQAMYHLKTGKTISAKALPQPVAAVAGIGNPTRFFKTLEQMGIQYVPYVFADHHTYRENDLAFKQSIVLMTEKDAVKCEGFKHESIYVLPIQASLNESFWSAFWSHPTLKELSKKCKI